KITVNNVTLVNKLLPNKGIYESTAFRNYILACCICYSLRVGVNFMESLYDTQKKTIHIINTSKIVAKERNDEYFYFSKKIPQAFNMYSYTFNIHKEIIKDLEELEDVSTTYRRNISECIESLKKYSDKVIVTKSTEVLT